VPISSANFYLTIPTEFGILLPMKRALLMASFIIGNLSILIVAMIFLTIYTTRSSSADTPTDLVLESPESNYAVVGTSISLPSALSGQIIVSDARALLLYSFYKRYRSPMVGLGKDLVAAADKYGIPFSFVTAVGQCEGASGKTMPANSFNTWGYGIYGGKVKQFENWQAGIEAVTKDLALNYFKRGLNTPEEIMARYAPSSTPGYWVSCVNQYLTELR
jgi:hypothetical protein